MASSDFWRGLAAEFREIPKGYTLVALLEFISDKGKTCWRVAGISDSIYNFEALARRSAVGIANTETADLLTAWLDALKQEGFGFVPGPTFIEKNPDGSEGKQHTIGRIVSLSEISARLCKKLESSAVQSEFEEKKRNRQRTRSFLHRQFEALKQIRELKSGPHEQIPEALVRTTLAKELGIRPEEVTPEQINRAVASLLPYYPAITLVPASVPSGPDAIKPETESVGTQLNRLRDECRLTTEELAELIDIETRSVQRHLAGDSVPYDRHLRAYEREFSKLLNRKVVIRKLS